MIGNYRPATLEELSARVDTALEYIRGGGTPDGQYRPAAFVMADAPNAASQESLEGFQKELAELRRHGVYEFPYDTTRSLANQAPELLSKAQDVNRKIDSGVPPEKAMEENIPVAQRAEREALVKQAQEYYSMGLIATDPQTLTTEDLRARIAQAEKDKAELLAREKEQAAKAQAAKGSKPEEPDGQKDDTAQVGNMLVGFVVAAMVVDAIKSVAGAIGRAARAVGAFGARVLGIGRGAEGMLLEPKPEAAKELLSDQAAPAPSMDTAKPGVTPEEVNAYVPFRLRHYYGHLVAMLGMKPDVPEVPEPAVIAKAARRPEVVNEANAQHAFDALEPN